MRSNRSEVRFINYGMRKSIMAFALVAGGVLCVSHASHAAGPPTAQVNTTGLAVTDDAVTVGILHSVTGTMAISEAGSVEAEKLAIDQINEMGGVLGRKIKTIDEDGASDWPTFAEKSKKLLEKRQSRCGDGLLDVGITQGRVTGIREK